MSKMDSPLINSISSLLDENYQDLQAREILESDGINTYNKSEIISEIPDGGAVFIKEPGIDGADLIHFYLGGQLVETQDKWVRTGYESLTEIANAIERDPSMVELITIGKARRTAQVPKWFYEQLMKQKEDSQYDPDHYFASDQELYRQWMEQHAEALYSEKIYTKVTRGSDNPELRMRMAKVARLYRDTAEGMRESGLLGRIPTYNKGDYGF